MRTLALEHDAPGLRVDALIGRHELDGPWRTRDLGRLVVTSALAALVAVAAWRGALSASDEESQLSWLSIGIVALIVHGAGSALWILRGRLAVGAARTWLLPDLVRATAPSFEGDADALVSGAGMTRAHRPTCLLVRGKVVRPVGPASPLERCEVCQP